MLYTIFMKSFKGDKKNTTKIVLQNLKELFKKYTTIHLPGYMSKTKSNIDNFLREMNITDEYYFFKGMNGNEILKSKPLKYTIQEYHNDNSSIKSSIIEYDDHSKMILFLEKNSDKIKNTDNIIFDKNNYNCKAVLIGSSNQSYSTYLKSPVNKGEADIFIIDYSAIDEKYLLNIYGNLPSDIKDNIVISKELDNCNNSNILSSIFHDVFIDKK